LQGWRRRHDLSECRFGAARWHHRASQLENLESTPNLPTGVLAGLCERLISGLTVEAKRAA
jgi:hypothetical protein